MDGDIFRTTSDGTPELIRDGIKIQLLNDGEGMNGGYDPRDPRDIPFLTFNVFTSGDVEVGSGYFHHEDDLGEWYEEVRAKYGTQLPVTMTVDECRLALEILMGPIHDRLIDGVGDGRVYQRLSWASLESLRDGKVSCGRWVVGDYICREGHHEVDGHPQGDQG